MCPVALNQLCVIKVTNILFPHVLQRVQIRHQVDGIDNSWFEGEEFCCSAFHWLKLSLHLSSLQAVTSP